MILAEKGHIFILTEKGYKHTLESGNKQAIAERRVGKPLKGYEDSAYESWVRNSWVEEVKIKR